MNTAQKQIAPERLLAVVAAVAKEARPHVEPRAGLDTSLEKELGLDSLARAEISRWAKVVKAAGVTTQ